MRVMRNHRILWRGCTPENKPAFRKAFKRRRRLVPVDNFYEWLKTATGKQPYALALADRCIMALAGLWGNWRSPAGEWVRSFAIVTTAPNQLCAKIHDRMPVILKPDAWPAWLGDEPADEPQLKALLTPYPADDMICWRVSARVGNVRNNDFEPDRAGHRGLNARPQRAWRVLGESGVVSRFEALRSSATPLIGRDEELELLSRRWHQAEAGEGRVVLISGEPGIGKSRLAAAIAAATEAEQPVRVRWFCSPHHQDSALYPFIVQLERAAGFTRDDRAENRLAKLDAVLAPGSPGDDEVTLLRELLSLPNTAAELNLSPQKKRETLFAAMLSQLVALAQSQPVLAALEDAHWIDPTSRELLDLMVDQVRRLPILLIITFRPEFQAPWAGQPHVTTLALSRLGERHVTALVRGVAGNVPLGSEVVAEIVERTDGVPLFVEELTKAVLEGAGQDNRVAAVLSASPLPASSCPRHCTPR